MAEGIVVGGKVYPLLHPVTKHPIPVLGPKDHRQEFKAGDGFNKKRVKPIDLGVFHWTGSENQVETMVEVLRSRKLGIEFSINPYGVLYQFCDPAEVDTADAGIVNSRSWGVEIVSAGLRRASTLWMEPKQRKPPMGPRFAYDTMIHGKKVRCYDFYPAQTVTALVLADTMATALSYPRDVATSPGVLPGLSSFRGSIGHFQITEEKLDPGTRFMGHLAEYMKTGVLPADLVSPMAA